MKCSVSSYDHIEINNFLYPVDRSRIYPYTCIYRIAYLSAYQKCSAAKLIFFDQYCIYKTKHAYPCNVTRIAM